MNRFVILMLLIFAGMMIAIATIYFTFPKTEPISINTTRYVLNVNPEMMGIIPQIDYFIESQNPSHFKLSNIMKQVYESLGDSVIIYPRYAVYKGNDSNCDEGLCSTRGVGELKQDAMELCIYYSYGPKAYYEWITGTVPEEYNGTQINECYYTNGRNILLDEARVFNSALKTTSYSLYINGALYKGKKDYESITKAVCQEYTEKPSTCLQG